MNAGRIISSSIGVCSRYLGCQTVRREFRTWSPLRYPVVPFKLADIGEGIKEVTLKQWFVKPNQTVNEFDELCEVESDKASVVLTSRYGGEVHSLYFEEGDVATVGSVLMDIRTDNTEHFEAEQERREAVAETPPVEMTSPPVERDPDRYDKVLATPAVRALAKQHDININQILGTGKDGRVCEKDVESFLNQPEKFAKPVVATREEYDREKSTATPAVRRIAKEYNVNINEVKGTGKGGRISKDDMLNYLNQPQEVETIVPDTVETLAGYRKVMSKIMTESNKIPTLTLSEDIEVSLLQNLRNEIKPFLEKEKVKLTLLSFLVKAISLSLEKYPILNTHIDAEGREIRYLGYHNVGIAVDTDRGLVVPNVKNVQKLNIKSIAKEIQRLQVTALEHRLTIKDTTDGTFTISNIGSIAGTVTKPLILPPQVAIVGVGRIQQVPRFDENGQIKKSSIINVSWSADHRVIDGGTIARFSNSVKSYIENPVLLMVDS